MFSATLPLLVGGLLASLELGHCDQSCEYYTVGVGVGGDGGVGVVFTDGFGFLALSKTCFICCAPHRVLL